MLLIRSRGLRGYGAAIIGGFTTVWAVIAAFAFQIWARPGAAVAWLVLIILCAIAAIAIEVLFRLDYIKCAEGKLSWRYRQGGRGERPLSAIVGIGRIGDSARINFSEGEPLLIGVVWFKPSDIDKLVGAVRSLGPLALRQ